MESQTKKRKYFLEDVYDIKKTKTGKLKLYNPNEYDKDDDISLLTNIGELPDEFPPEDIDNLDDLEIEDDIDAEYQGEQDIDEEYNEQENQQVSSQPTFCTGLVIKAYGPLDDSSEALSFKSYITCLAKHGASVKIDPNGQEYNISTESERNRTIFFGLKNSEKLVFNILLIHLPVVNYEEIIKNEKTINKNITVLCVSTSSPYDKNIKTTLFDVMTVPSEKYCSNLKYTTTCPTYPVTFPLEKQQLESEGKDESKFIYYSFIDSLADAELIISSFLKVFHVDDGVLLYLHTPPFLLHDVSIVAKTLKGENDKTPGVLVHSRQLDEERLHQYHSKGHVYVNVSKLESIKLGAIESVLYGNLFISTSGHYEEYIKGGLYITSKEENIIQRDLMKFMKLTYEEYENCKCSAVVNLKASEITETSVALGFCRIFKKIFSKKEISL